MQVAMQANIHKQGEKMNATMKLLTLGALAVVFTSFQPAYARQDADEVEESAPKKKSGKKAPQVSKMYVAIDKFENKANVDANQFGTIRARIQQAVVGTRKFEVLEREQMKNALSEQNLIASGMTNGDDEHAPEAGKMKAAGYVIYGNVLFYGIDQSQSIAGGAGSASMRTKVELQIKITSAETGKILASKSIIGIGQQSRQATADTQPGGNMQEQCEREAVAQAAHLVVDALRDLVYPAKIIKVGKKSVTINMTNEEVAEDDLFDVFEEGDEIVDDDTGAVTRVDGDEVGRIRIKRPGPQSSTAVPDDEDKLDLKDLEVGYIVRRVSEATLKKEKAKRKRERNSIFEERF